MQKALIIAGVLIGIVGIGYFVTNSSTDTASTVPSAETETPAPPDQTADSEAANPTDSTSTPSSATSTGSPGTYTDYDPAAVAASDAEHIILFFHATWCPSCRALEADITENAEQIPSDVAIYQVDYDTATELKRQYGITTQHSLIEIEADGTAVGNITHPLTLEGVINTI